MPKATSLTKPMWPSTPIPHGGPATPANIFDVKKASGGKGTQVSTPAAASAVKIPGN